MNKDKLADLKTNTGSKASLEFVTFLRGIAAILVVVSHLLFVFWSGGGQVAATWRFLETETIPRGELISEAKEILDQFHLDVGRIGVSLFFLITGFLSRASVSRQSDPKRFFLNRMLRVFPFYVFGFSITFGVIYIYTRAKGMAFPYSALDWFTQVTLLRQFIYLPSIDMISWTLVADFEFWFMLAFMMSIRRTGGKDMLVSGLAVTTASLLCGLTMKRVLAAGYLTLYQIQSHVTLGAFCLSFMLIGWILSEYFYEKIDLIQLAAGLFVAYCCFVVCAVVYSPDALGYIVSYSFSIIVFILCMMLEKKQHAMALFGNIIVKKVAGISFPLYIVHALNGYILQTALYQAGVNPICNFCITILATFILATLLYRYCEKPIHEWLTKIMQFRRNENECGER